MWQTQLFLTRIWQIIIIGIFTHYLGRFLAYSGFMGLCQSHMTIYHVTLLWCVLCIIINDSNNHNNNHNHKNNHNNHDHNNNDDNGDNNQQRQ